MWTIFFLNDHCFSHKTKITANAIPTVKNPMVNPSIPSLQRGEHLSVRKPDFLSELKEKKFYFIPTYLLFSNLFIICALDELLLAIVESAGFVKVLFGDHRSVLFGGALLFGHTSDFVNALLFVHTSDDFTSELLFDHRSDDFVYGLFVDNGSTSGLSY